MNENSTKRQLCLKFSILKRVIVLSVYLIQVGIRTSVFVLAAVEVKLGRNGKRNQRVKMKPKPIRTEMTDQNQNKDIMLQTNLQNFLS